MPMDPSKKTPYWHCLQHNIIFYTEEEFRQHYELNEDHQKERSDREWLKRAIDDRA